MLQLSGGNLTYFYSVINAQCHKILLYLRYFSSGSTAVLSRADATGFVGFMQTHPHRHTQITVAGLPLWGMSIKTGQTDYFVIGIF